MMKVKNLFSTGFWGCLLLLLVACNDPASLPTDQMGPMLTPPTNTAVVQPNNVPTLVIYDCLKMDEGEFWLLDAESEAWSKWYPDTATTSRSTVSGANANLLHYTQKEDCLDLSTSTDALVLFLDGQTAVLPQAGYSQEPNHERNLSPIISPDGRWRIRASSEQTRIYNLATNVEHNIVDRGGWIVDWSPNGDRFLMSDDNGSYIAKLNGETESLPESAEKETFQVGQWLTEDEMILVKNESLFRLDLNSGKLETMEGFGRILWIRYSPDQAYIATVEKVDCVRKTDNSSWIIGTERCADEIFLYDGDGQNRRRISAVDFSSHMRPIWLPSAP
ncbi:hypothetical protein [Candidatus Leptofilum sp.]|uniref:hypothetical protein n=1 Tax=Candidatus Leptofilum sp. TaxID=3241576 RepID=UPI003B5CB1D0